MPRALQADKLGNVLKVLAKNVLIASGENRHGADAESQQLLLCRKVVDHVDRDEIDVFFRKKLFRLQATASARLGEQNEFVGDVFHGRIDLIDTRLTEPISGTNRFQAIGLPCCD